MAREDDELSMTERMFDEKEHVDFAANLAADNNSGMTPLSDLPAVSDGNILSNGGQNGGDESVEQ